ncbi:phosphoribosylanthranilate isomerase [Saccharibacillus kuerlensis]|uniref:N-(5'-phosphoribosyl)anthranilate isomerase n=1 Tax=Saccharibacillus kuerlensis TaxID=459527 RepID=A0ABQ2L5Q0_9BACL|nr:phosphoribosylanthranilate isomerase [Saccharibacillus kuerlensis]GGO04365.1 N-(5'-phosphoribosyl)anthranilate isomerase [Saccharibacillus kuerlensis]
MDRSRTESERTDSTPKRPEIKLCGIRTAEAMLKAEELQADYIGLVFAPSRRQVEPKQAAELIGELDTRQMARPYVVGVFVNPSMDELEYVLSIAALDVVQLHGQENPDMCRKVRERFGIQVFKAVSIGSEDSGESHADRAERLCSAYEGAVDAMLIDTYDPLYGGGSGKTFNWEIVPLYREAAHAHGLKLFVAGGLTPDNAGELVRNYGPDGIDVSSGVESDGHKDMEKMTLFVERAVLS